MRTLDKEFWREKSVFISGHTGFKGAWLSHLLSRLGARVYGYSLAPDHAEQFYVSAGVEARIVHSTIADIRDKDRLEEAVRNANPDIIFHLAAQPLVRYGYQSPAYTFDVNVMGTANILDVAMSIESQLAVIAITTDKVYSNREQIWPYREYDELGGTDPYSASKVCAEFVIKSYMNSVERPKGVRTNIASARAGNVIGGGDWSEGRLIPDIIKSAQLGQTLTIRNPYATRPWQHVLDCLMGYLLLAESVYQNPEDFVGEWNFGPPHGDEWNVDRVVGYIASQFNPAPKVDINFDMQQNMKEHLSLSLDSTKAIKYLNWAPRLNVKEALDYTLKEYKASSNGESFLNEVNASINNFFDKDMLNEC